MTAVLSSLPPPPRSRAVEFLRSTVSTPANALISLAILAFLAVTLPGFIRWTLLDAVWSGASGKACAGIDAACWLFVRLRFDQILYGLYPAPERWRIDLAGAIGLVGLALLMLPRLKAKTAIASLFLISYPFVAGVLLHGGVLGLAAVPTRSWGGLMLTLVVAAWTIATSIPLGLLLALARRSELPVLSWTAAGFIDVMRGLPLIGVLFLAIVMFPFFMPPGTEFDKLLRALIAFTLFDAAILAEVFRGGLQAVAREQREGGLALGLKRWQVMLLVIIPQAVTNALPGIVNVCIVIVKETVVVLIVGLFDFLGIIQNGIIDPEWLVGDQVRATAYLFAALVFWSVCFSISRYSMRIERRRRVGQRN